jgi:hypothetical protein
MARAHRKCTVSPTEKTEETGAFYGKHARPWKSEVVNKQVFTENPRY